MELLVQRGELAEAQRILLAGVLIGDHRAAQQLPELLVWRGCNDEARQLARFGLNADGAPAAPPGIMD
ncbi:hypothetical protein HRW12_10025 [Streptomyces lunaelactis]|uniref:hypothetical protein n=1 Tax=Streptomyces lunaelactis TaxID=1535768 RepID=UPI00158552B0|nr:hypothetical protein [Streptomyces lunaelactis]NUK34099.1 hypothetical protein [Streptomyces lunaelactis]